jgi:hypothetical protein
MCPACVLTIGGGLLIARRLGINNLFAIGILTVLLSLFLDIAFRKINKGKALFNYQRIIIPIVLLIVISIIFQVINYN